MSRQEADFVESVLMSWEVGNEILDAFGAFGAADVGACLSELAETPGSFLEILFHIVSS